MNSLIWPEIKLVPDFMTVLVTCKFDEDLIKNEVAILQTTFSPIINLWELLVAMETGTLIQSAQKKKTYAAFPTPIDAAHKI